MECMSIYHCLGLSGSIVIRINHIENIVINERIKNALMNDH
jgi:hypothetical protein